LFAAVIAEIERGVNLRDAHPFGSIRDFYDLVSGSNFPFFQNAKIKSWPVVRDQLCGHLRIAYADADAVASDAGCEISNSAEPMR